MPTRVQDRPAQMSRMPSEKFSEHDSAHVNRSMQQHKDALMLALGSILAPKRPFTPQSRSSSGTASPAHSSSFATPSSPVLPPPPPNSTPVHVSDIHFFPSRNIYHPHTPSRLGQSDSREPSVDPLGSPSSSPRSSSSSSHPPSPTEELPPPLALPPLRVIVEPAEPPSVHAPQPRDFPTTPGSAGAHTRVPRVGTPKSKFVETLESKSAWDALIHGSFS